MYFVSARQYFNCFKFIPKLEHEITQNCSTVLDLGCGPESPLKYFSAKLKHSVGVDNFLPYINHSRKLGIHNKYWVLDVLEACRLIGDNVFDCVLLLDIIEHLPPSSGLKLLGEAERIAAKKIIIYTPNGFLKQVAVDGNAGQRHLSGWTVKEIKMRGYRIFGMSGLKYLRKERGEIRFRPKFFWQFLASASQPLVYKFPQAAFQILAVKRVSSNTG